MFGGYSQTKETTTLSSSTGYSQSMVDSSKVGYSPTSPVSTPSSPPRHSMFTCSESKFKLLPVKDDHSRQKQITFNILLGHEYTGTASLVLYLVTLFCFTGPKARDFFMKSMLPTDTLSKIWYAQLIETIFDVTYFSSSLLYIIISLTYSGTHYHSHHQEIKICLD